MEWRPTEREKPLVAVLVTIILFLLASLLYLVSSNEPPEIGDGICWHEPTSISVDKVEADHATGTLLVNISLLDAEGRVTEWDGRLHLKMADRDNRVVLDREVDVKAEDFITRRSDDVVCTQYQYVVRFEELSHITPGMLTCPELNLAVRAAFEYSGGTLVNNVWWWESPSKVRVEGIDISEEEEKVDLRVFLYDTTGGVTKWSGDLRIVMADSLGFEMYNESRYVQARDFDVRLEGRTTWVYHETSVPFEDIAPSADRLRERPDGSIGRWMRVYAWFSHDGQVDGQDPVGPYAVLTAEIIPDALLAENRAPSAMVEAEDWGLEGAPHAFDASGTTDDAGTIGLAYSWDFGDGTVPTVTSRPLVEHAFDAPGEYVVVLEVRDVEVATSSASVPVRVLPDGHLDADPTAEDPAPPLRPGGLIRPVERHVAGSERPASPKGRT